MGSRPDSGRRLAERTGKRFGIVDSPGETTTAGGTRGDSLATRNKRELPRTTARLRVRRARGRHRRWRECWPSGWTCPVAAGMRRPTPAARPLRAGSPRGRGDAPASTGAALATHASPPCTFLNDFARLVSWSRAGRREPPTAPCVSNTWGGLVPRRSAIDECPVGSLRR